MFIMKKYTERLEIRIDPLQLEKLKEESKKRKISVGEIVREAITKKYSVSREEKIEEAKKMFQLNSPVTEWEEMKKEIEEGSKE